MEKYKTFKDFYPYYIEEHSKPKTKLLHFIGTSISLFFLVQLVITFDPIYLIYALLSGYGFAWVAHFFIEKNKPATFTYPFYSFIGDHKMFVEILMGKHKIF
ncbi:MAG: putative membrane protein [SAR86 cluster bacterium SAR86B]|uniref:Putative membrane protein n=1 Tax=SAR86 cluster bacterium SAR86B TaxID=1123867 RepID=J5KI04_9GAMM|nr:MAG: putative membrane protein [SAR86 cluster bacterium SAR86B]|tara:strand:- start:144 stop:449 length:306 start_codon:yes stop_codon:yes gene_type:complete